VGDASLLNATVSSDAGSVEITLSGSRHCLRMQGWRVFCVLAAFQAAAAFCFTYGTAQE